MSEDARSQQLMLLADGELSPEEEAKVAEELRASGSRREELVRITRQRLMIAELLAKEEIPATKSATSRAAVQARPARSAYWRLLGTVAAAVLLVAGLYLARGPAKDPSDLSNATDIVVRRTLRDGTEVSLAPGVRAMALGEDVERNIRQVIRLDSGQINVRTPKSMSGTACRIQTPEGLWVETLGTTFAATRTFENENGERDMDAKKLAGLVTAVLLINVMEGEVRAGSAGAQEARSKAGSSMKVVPGELPQITHKDLGKWQVTSWGNPASLTVMNDPFTGEGVLAIALPGTGKADKSAMGSTLGRAVKPGKTFESLICAKAKEKKIEQSGLKVAVGFQTQNGYYESTLRQVRAGAWQSLSVDLTGSDFKCQKTGWAYKAQLVGSVTEIYLIFYTQNAWSIHVKGVSLSTATAPKPTVQKRVRAAEAP